MHLVLLAIAIGVGAGCGLELTGLGEIGPPDGGDAMGAPLGACARAIPAGWSLVAYEVATAACPAGYGTEHREVSGAQAGPNACGCACTVVQSPSCATGTADGELRQLLLLGAACTQSYAPIAVGSTACQPSNGTFIGVPAAAAIAPLALTGGTCTGSPKGNVANVAKSLIRYCDVPVGDMETVCSGAAPTGTSACIVSQGDVACPGTSPFSNRTVVGDDEALVCAGCSSCTVSGTCNSPSLTFYSDVSCTKSIVDVVADGACVTTNAGTERVAAFEYSAEASPQCVATGADPAPSFQTVNPHTLCCR